MNYDQTRINLGKAIEDLSEDLGDGETFVTVNAALDLVEIALETAIDIAESLDIIRTSGTGSGL